MFLTGVAYKVPAAISGGVKSVNWTCTARSDSGSVSTQWKWAAAVYTQFNSDPNACGVKPDDSNNLDQYCNSDHAGTPENCKGYVTGGACGGGGSNWTGSYSGTVSQNIGSNCWSDTAYYGCNNYSSWGWGWGWGWNGWGGCNNSWSINGGGSWGNGGCGNTSCGNGGDGCGDGKWGSGWDNSGNCTGQGWSGSGWGW